MPELDHHPENESRYSCEKCEDSGVTKDEREYCSCHLGAARKNSDRFAEMIRGVPFTDAIWMATHATMKAERATAVAEKAVMEIESKKLMSDVDLALNLQDFAQKSEADMEIKLEKAEKDASRYRWFRENHETYVPNSPGKSLWGCKRQDYSLKSHAELDAAIDAAMSREPIAAEGKAE